MVGEDEQEEKEKASTKRVGNNKETRQNEQWYDEKANEGGGRSEFIVEPKE